MLRDRFLKRICALALVLMGSLVAAQAQAAVGATVGVVATDVFDTSAGKDRWQFTYHVTGGMPTDYGLTLFLPTASFADVIAPASSNAKFDAAYLPGIPGTDGLLTLTLLSDNSLPFDYSIFFTKLGSGRFADQAYELFDANFEPFYSAQAAVTVAAPPTNTVPEPSSLWLMGLGMVLLVHRATRSAQRWRLR